MAPSKLHSSTDFIFAVTIHTAGRREGGEVRGARRV